MSAREIGILVPLAVVCLAIGFYPKPMLEAITPSAEKVLAGYPALVTEYAANGSLLPVSAAGASEVAMAQDVGSSDARATQTNELGQTR